MTPQRLANRIQVLARYINSSEQPSLSRVSTLLTRLVIATDQSFGYSVREALIPEIHKAIPGAFGKRYDTNESGKGFKDGYISFGMLPVKWEEDGIIGGILFRCYYDVNQFRSEEPSTQDPNHAKWTGHSQGGGIMDLKIEACYYNHLLGGGCVNPDNGGATSGPVNLGPAVVGVDALEKTIEVEIDEPTVRHELEQIIQDILAHPPDYAQSAKRKRRNDSPTSSAPSLHKWLLKNNRDTVYLSELKALSRAQSQRGDGPYGQLLEKNRAYFAGKLVTDESK